MPHGGPWVRDTLGFHDWAQFLANRGYVVLQPNYRGSTGYGTTFVNMGSGEWGEKMQEDLTDGVNWMVREKIADPNNVCIVGGSYGGYAALLGIAKDSDLYNCSIAFAPVTNLKTYLNTYNRTPQKESLEARVIGNKSKKYLTTSSPDKQVKKINRR